MPALASLGGSALTGQVGVTGSFVFDAACSLGGALAGPGCGSYPWSSCRLSGLWGLGACLAPSPRSLSVTSRFLVQAVAFGFRRHWGVPLLARGLCVDSFPVERKLWIGRCRLMVQVFDAGKSTFFVRLRRRLLRAVSVFSLFVGVCAQQAGSALPSYSQLNRLFWPRAMNTAFCEGAASSP